MGSDSTVSSQLISRIGQFRDGDWDTAVRRRTELCLIDSLACYSAGRSLKHFAPSAIVASQLLGTNSDGSELSPFVMAYLYGQAANSLDYDDTLMGHPGAATIGAILALASHERLSTDRLLRGIAAGYEIQWLLSVAAAPSYERAALVRSVGVWDTVAASIGVSVSLGLEDSMIERVIGVAVSHSVLPYTAKWYTRPIPALKNNLGWAAAGAVMSTCLARAGQTGVMNALDGETGMWRMAGPAVLRVGFKHFPACWHLQEYLKTVSKLLEMMAPKDDVVEIIVAGPEEIKKFCQRDISGSADIAFSLPATFSLLISRVEPGPLWDSFGNGDDALRYAETFRYEESEDRAITLRTRRGSEMKAVVNVCGHYHFDKASWGLDEDGVLAKHARLTDTTLRTETAAALAARNSSESSVPDRLYRAMRNDMAIKHHESN
ncbi:uncharacterized protein N7446_014138 [Penicillium canescens]|uniref:MmgE/PrpD N-terminal domain-containing protein n=1 Tax=Penicillium canescens TaxID=5083 RepID=A0AAD6HXM2_PENCN|nr:uncharacterized protein N7446_014138 [Penicillium canescens]KAJ6022341.1 hypothetical protein N7460_014085 [Penicillium canescens]KAJ6038986.1 hypothetical protein N7446_014138 [Penicillium canescens]KAJ6066226.1 hypothetical protein N7444_000218 [Penicillium canescens]